MVQYPNGIKLDIISSGDFPTVDLEGKLSKKLRNFLILTIILLKGGHKGSILDSIAQLSIEITDKPVGIIDKQLFFRSDSRTIDALDRKLFVLAIRDKLRCNGDTSIQKEMIIATRIIEKKSIVLDDKVKS